jgi:hypothetical protein
LTPSARSANLIAGDGTKNGFPAPNKEPATSQKYDLTGKAPYKFESMFLQRRVERTAFSGSHAPKAGGRRDQCNACRHRIEPDVATMAGKYGAATPVRDWVGRLVCSQCGAWDISFVLTGAKL